jgi:iron complex outermembrane receptor protein
VVNLIPYTPRTFEGTQITARVGAIEEFYASEIKHGRRFGDDHGIFLYAGIAHHVGANEDFAPPVFGADTTVLGQSYEAGERATHTDFVKDNQAHRGLPKLKFHGHYTFGGFDFWARYTRGGVRHRAMNNLPDWYYFTGYQQATGTASYKHEPLDGLNMEYVFSYDMTDFEYGRAADNGMAWRTDEYYAKALADYKPWEYSYEFNGLPSPGYPNYDDKGWHYRFFSDPDTNGGDMPRWQTQMYSFVGEWQWTINDHWTTFLGGRADKHSYTDWLYSPRASVILTPNERDTFKAIYSRSTRTNLGAEMRVNWTTNGTQSRPEVLDMAEFRWERRHTDNLWLAFSGHYYNQNLIGWDTGNTKTGGLGRLKWFGLELESTYKNDRTRVTFSHSFTKLINFEPSAGTETFVTTEQFGFGRELNNWANHLTKITARRDINDRLNVDGSVRIYWGMPGNRSAAEYAISPRGEDNPTLWDPSYDVPFKPKAYLNLGLTYEPTDNTSVRFDAYNVLGWINDDLNQRLYANFDVNVSAAESRVMAPAFGVKATIEF